MSSWTTFFRLIIFLVLSPYILSLHLENKIMITIVIQLTQCRNLITINHKQDSNWNIYESKPHISLQRYTWSTFKSCCIHDQGLCKAVLIGTVSVFWASINVHGKMPALHTCILIMTKHCHFCRPFYQLYW